MIDELPTRQTKVASKLFEVVKSAQQLPGKLVEALLKGPPAEGQAPPPSGPPAPAGKPEAKNGEPSADPPPVSPAQVVKGANLLTPPPKD